MRIRALIAALVMGGALVGAATLTPATAATVGYRDFSYSGTSAPTGQKPQSKLWFNDGIWWGSLFNRATTDFEIYRYDWPSHTWSTTGVLIDERSSAFMDTLWDGSKLYVATAGATTSTTGQQARIVRYSYDPSTKRYSRDGGFPVNITNAGVKSIVLSKDSVGTLWATYTQGGKVWILHSTTSDNNWTQPYALPAAGASTIGTDEISAIVSYDGNKTGVMWSNQNDSTMYWASHVDGTADDVWEATAAYRRPKGADDHINLKSLQADPSGRVFAAVKTSLNDGATSSTDPVIHLLVLSPTGTWSSHTFGTVADNHTRAIVLIDAEHRQVYMFASAPCCSGGVIYMKQSSLDNISFPPGLGTPFIQSDSDLNINNPTSTKQNLSSATGLVVMASDDHTHLYLHNRLDLGGSPTPPPPSSPPDTSITSGPGGTVTSTSASFTYSSNPTGASFECALDGAGFSACPSSGMTYSGLAAGSHTFSVRAVSSSGTDPSPASRTWTVAAPAGPTLFSDDFESGLGAWTVSVSGDASAAAVAGAGYNGTTGARFSAEATTGSAAFARRSLGGSYSQVTVEARVRWERASTTNAVPVFRLRDSAGNVVAYVVRRSDSGRLQVSYGGTTYSSTAVLPVSSAQFSLLTFKVGVAGSGASTVELLVDGVSVYRTTTATLSAAPANLQIGSDWKQELFTATYDDVVVRSTL